MTTRANGIFFDLGETLVSQNIEDNIVTREALRQIAKTLGRPESTANLFRTYQQGYRVNHAIRSRHHVEIPVQTWMRELLTREMGRSPPDPVVESAINIIVESRAANAVRVKGTKSIVERLADKRVKLGVISNVSSHEVALQIMRNVRLFEYFDAIITSAQTGIRKPDPGIFLYALRELGVRPNRAVHVGDSEFHDVRGANPVGMTTVLVKEQPEGTPTDADYHFRKLTDASNLLVSL